MGWLLATTVKCGATIAPEVAIFISQPLPFVRAFVEDINATIQEHNPLSPGLSAIQRGWLSFCLMAIMLTNTIGWVRFERVGLGRYSQGALSRSRVCWPMRCMAAPPL